MTQKPPRKPGSQVAPGQKPLHRDGHTATTHSRVPIDQATAGKTYRVRDKDWEKVWAENLSHADANKLKETLVAQRKSKTARVEEMTVKPPDGYVAPPPAEVAHAGAASPTLPVAPQSTPNPDPELEQARMAALAAARPHAHAAQARAAIHPPARTVPRDKTVTAQFVRTTPAPPDKTISKEPPRSWPAPPAVDPDPNQLQKSPLKAATELDGEELPPDAITDDELPDLAGDVGAGPSDADLEHAKQQAEAERAAKAAAKAADR